MNGDDDIGWLRIPFSINYLLIGLLSLYFCPLLGMLPWEAMLLRRRIVATFSTLIWFIPNQELCMIWSLMLLSPQLIHQDPQLNYPLMAYLVEFRHKWRQNILRSKIKPPHQQVHLPKLHPLLLLLLKWMRFNPLSLLVERRKEKINRKNLISNRKEIKHRIQMLIPKESEM